MKNPFKEKTAMVTGGASGMGRSLCRGLAARGARVVVADINGEEATALPLRSMPWDSMHALLLSTFLMKTPCSGPWKTRLPNPGPLISTSTMPASVFQLMPLIWTIGQWRKIFDVNLFGVLYGTMAAYTVMARQGCGHIVNIASMAGFAPFSINTPYTAAKYGVVGLTQALRHETEDLGVRMTLVCPGIVRTAFYDAIEIIGTDRETYMARMPRRLITPERAAEIILEGVARNRAMIVFPLHAKVLWWISKFAPFVLGIINRKMVREYRSLRK